MTDITDQDRRDMLEWARIAVASKDNQEHEPWVTAARYILATVDAPAPTLAERLREQFYYPEHTDEQGGIILDAQQMEKDLAEARAEVERLTAENERAREAYAGQTEALKKAHREHADTLALARHRTAERDEAQDAVERLTAERDRIASGRYITYAEVDGKPVQKGAENNAETPDPADVKPGEVWKEHIWYDDVPYSGTAIKSSGGDWTVTRDDGSRTTYRMNEYVELVSRLVPAPRTITDHHQLDRSKRDTIIRDAAGVVCSRDSMGDAWTTFTSLANQRHLIALPATVLWEPEA